MVHFEEVVGVDEAWTQYSEAGKAGMLALCANESRENPTTCYTIIDRRIPCVKI